MPCGISQQMSMIPGCVGMALHASGEPWARAVWDTWSQRSEKYDPPMQQQKWESFTADGG